MRLALPLLGRSSRLSPDGQWVAYTVDTLDKESGKRKRITHIWMSSWSGDSDLQLTYGTE